MSGWIDVLITGLTGIAGVATGSVMQASFSAAQARRARLYDPAADLSSSLRGTATSIDYLIRPLTGDARQPAEPHAFANAKQLLGGRRTPLRHRACLPPDSKVYEAATAAVQALRFALELVSTLYRSSGGEGRHTRLASRQVTQGRKRTSPGSWRQSQWHQPPRPKRRVVSSRCLLSGWRRTAGVRQCS
jgi:hypothetical protein